MDWKVALGEKIYSLAKEFCKENKMSLAQLARLAILNYLKGE